MSSFAKHYLRVFTSHREILTCSIGFSKIKQKPRVFKQLTYSTNIHSFSEPTLANAQGENTLGGRGLFSFVLLMAFWTSGKLNLGPDPELFPQTPSPMPWVLIASKLPHEAKFLNQNCGERVLSSMFSQRYESLLIIFFRKWGFGDLKRWLRG